jgi:hypothetical protein
MTPSVVKNQTDKHFYKVVARNEDGTLWARRHGRLIVLEPAYGPIYDAADRTPRWPWKEFGDKGHYFS